MLANVGERWWVPAEDGEWCEVEIAAVPHRDLVLIVTSEYGVARLTHAPAAPGYLGLGSWHRTALVPSDMWQDQEGTCCFVGTTSVETQTVTLWWEDGREQVLPSKDLRDLGLRACLDPGWGVPFNEVKDRPRLGQVWRAPTGHLYEYLREEGGLVEVRAALLRGPAYVATRRWVPKHHFETFCYIPRRSVVHAHTSRTTWSGIRRSALYKAGLGTVPLMVPPKVDHTPTRYDLLLDEFLCQHR